MELLIRVGQEKKSPYQRQVEHLLPGETFKHPLRSREGTYCTVLGAKTSLADNLLALPVVVRGGTTPEEVCVMVFSDGEYVTVVDLMKRVEISLFPS